MSDERIVAAATKSVDMSTEDEEFLVTVTHGTVVSDQGTVVVFEGIDEEGATRRFGVDHCMAQDLVDAIEREGEIMASVEGWQLLN